MRSIAEQINRFLTERKSHRRWLSFLLCCALLVSGATAGILMLTGIAFSKEERELRCPVTEQVAHTHDENCYDEDGKLVCPLPELEEHTHGPECYVTEKILACGREEAPGHVHDESCYAKVRGELICTDEDEEHEHTETCYAYESTLICGLEEGDGGHSHTDDCYEEKSTLVCEKPEITETHTHTETCFVIVEKDEPDSTTEQTARKMSTEDPAVTQAEETEQEGSADPTVPEETPAAVPQETEDTMPAADPEGGTEADPTEVPETAETSEEPRTTEEESEGSAPEETAETEPSEPGTESTEAPESVSEEESSSETQEGPVSDPTADVETPAMWEERFAALTLTGQWKNDLLTIARTQLNYRESVKNFEAAGDGTLKGITRYGQWANQPYADWDGLFVAFCLHYAGIPAEEFPAGQNIAQFITALQEKSRNAFSYYAAAADHEPAAGDVIFFEMPVPAGDPADAGDYIPGMRVGIVSGLEKKEDGSVLIRVIEGDHQDAVAETVYIYSELKNVSFGILPEDLQEAQFPARHFEQTAGGLNVTVDAERGTFPAGTVMMVAPVQDDTVIFAATGAVDANVIGVQAVDITFCTASGEPVEPLLPVRVTMSRTNDTAPVDPVVVHVDDEGEATIIEQTEEKQEDEDGVVFEADAFSVYALVYTVDLHWEVNGRQYDFGIPGGGFVNFSRLVESLGITGEEESEKAQDPAEPAGDALELNRLKVTEQTKLFVAQVEQMSFSAPDLVWVGKAESDTTIGALKAENALAVEYSADLTQEQIDEIDAQTVMAGDWVLISVKPFDTEETLTVTLSDGQSFSILVTDAQITETVITASGETWEITVTYGPAARIPDGAKLQVREILPEDPEYAEYYRKAMREIGLMVAPDEGTPAAEDTAGPEAGPDGTDQEEPFEGMEGVDYSRFFDIEILADGEKVEPQAEVTVDIRLLDAPDTVETTPKVVHFGAEGPELMNITETEAAEFRFASDEFSVYSVVYTVDFHFEYNGRTFDFTLKGGDAVSFARLAEVLGLAESYEQVENMPAGADEPADVDGSTEDAVATDADAVTNDDIQISDATGRYLEQVEKVEFTDPQLLWVGKIEKDCITWDIQEANGLEISFVSGTTQDEYNELMTRRFTAPDWVLISLKPFETEEALLITMKSGDVLAIKVTDDRRRGGRTEGTDHCQSFRNDDRSVRLLDRRQLQLPGCKRHKLLYYQKYGRTCRVAGALRE